MLAVVAGIVTVAATSSGEEEPGPAAEERLVRALAQPVPGGGQRVPGPDVCVPRAGAGAARSAVGYAVAAAATFGTFFVVLEHATARAAPAGGGRGSALAVSLAVQVGALFVTLLAATRHTRSCLRPGRSLGLAAVTIGLLDVGADLLVTIAVDRGPLAVVGPLASLDPVVTTLVALVVLRERVGLGPGIGVAAALAGILLIATG